MNRSQLIDQQRRYLSFLPHVRKQFGNIPGVHLIGLGAKERNGEILEEWAFRFYVEKKKPLDKIPGQEKIPKQIFDIQTDVISFFEKENLICEECETDNLTINDSEYRDDGIRGGISIRNEHFDNDHATGYGTLGILARRKSDNALVGLTCSHVVNAGSDSNTALDVKIGQPKYWISCCCCPRGYIGDVKRATFTDDLDCALIEIHEDIRDKVTSNNTENKIEGFPADISGAAAIVCFDTLKKYGRATGLTEGKVSEIAFGTNHMLIEHTGGDPDDPFACHGDSGSAIINSSNEVVGLLVAARRSNMTMAIATHIKPVLEDLGITIAGTDVVDIGEPVGGGALGCELYYWPGGQSDTNLNPVESFNSSDFDLEGDVNWDVSKGAPGAIIIETNSQTAPNLESITVRYDTVSASKNPTDAVWIEATKTGEPPITKFRTVFKLSVGAINASNVLDSDNLKRFAATGGTDNQAGFAVPGTDGATWFLAKAEIIFEILPADLDWVGKGLKFETGNIAGSVGSIVARRETSYTKGEQPDGASHRTHTDQVEYISAGDSSLNDFQEAFIDSPGKIFRLANEGFDPTNLLQGYTRADFRDYLEFHNGSEWIRISPYAEWFANLTASLSGTGSPPPSVGTVNTIGTGSSSEKIPNQPPTLTVTDFQEVKPGEVVTMLATPSDADNDAVTVNWVQADGPNVVLSSTTGNSVTFNAPANDPQLKFTATADDGTGTLSRTAGNHLSAATVVTVNVVEWKNVGGGDPVPDRNMTEDFNAADFGIGAGALNWDVTAGGTNAVIIEADGVPVAGLGTHNGASTIKVRYATKSGDLTRAQSVKIQATHPGNGKIWYKRRTVFRVTVAVHATDTKSHLIPSNQGATGNDHFCTAKAAGNMVLDATLDPNPPGADFTWSATGRAITFPSVGGDRTTAHIDRNPASGLRVPIKIQVGGDEVYEGITWFIWSTGSLYDRIAPRINFTAIQTILDVEYKFKFILEPVGIVTSANDIPDLTGANSTNVPDVPAADVSVWNKGVNLAGGANKKWDVSRRLRFKVINVENVPGSVAFQPTLHVNNPNWPSDLVVGNDDTHVLEAGFPEDNDPYNAPNIGEIHAFDSPSLVPFNAGARAEGDVGDTFERRMHFQEFARVELDGNWYVISDPLLWRFHARVKKASESDDSTDYDGDGAENKELWIDNNSILDGTNNSW